MIKGRRDCISSLGGIPLLGVPSIKMNIKYISAVYINKDIIYQSLLRSERWRKQGLDSFKLYTQVHVHVIQLNGTARHSITRHDCQISNKLEELKGRMQSAKEKYDVIGITEIYPKNCRYLPGKAKLNIQGYELYLNEKKDNERGIALYIRQDLKAEEVRMEGEFKESIWTKIKLSGKDCLLIGCIYVLESEW